MVNKKSMRNIKRKSRKQSRKNLKKQIGGAKNPNVGAVIQHIKDNYNSFSAGNKEKIEEIIDDQKAILLSLSPSAAAAGTGAAPAATDAPKIGHAISKKSVKDAATAAATTAATVAASTATAAATPKSVDEYIKHFKEELEDPNDTLSKLDTQIYNVLLFACHILEVFEKDASGKPSEATSIRKHINNILSKINNLLAKPSIKEITEYEEFKEIQSFNKKYNNWLLGMEDERKKMIADMNLGKNKMYLSGADEFDHTKKLKYNNHNESGEQYKWKN